MVGLGDIFRGRKNEECEKRKKEKMWGWGG